MARSLCASRDGALADVLRSARRREQELGKERGCPRGVHFAKVVRSQRRTVGHAFVRCRSSVGEFRAARVPPGPGGAWDGRIRLRARTCRTADTRRISSRSHGRSRKTGTEKIAAPEIAGPGKSK